MEIIRASERARTFTDRAGEDTRVANIAEAIEAWHARLPEEAEAKQIVRELLIRKSPGLSFRKGQGTEQRHFRRR